MAHIHTDPGQHDHTASAYIFRIDGPEPAILMHTHRLLKQYMQFGGHVELDESPWQAVCREIREETGYDMDQLQLLQPATRMSGIVDKAVIHPVAMVHLTHQFGDDDHYHSDVTYPFITREAPRNKPDEGETADMKELTRAEVESLGDDETPANVRKTIFFAFDQILPTWKPVDPAEFSS